MRKVLIFTLVLLANFQNTKAEGEDNYIGKETDEEMIIHEEMTWLKLEEIKRNLLSLRTKKHTHQAVIDLIEQLEIYSTDGIPEASYLLGIYYLGGILPFKLSTQYYQAGPAADTSGFFEVLYKGDFKGHFGNDWLLDLSLKIEEDNGEDTGYRGDEYLYRSPLNIEKAVHYLGKASSSGHPHAMSILAILSRIALRTPLVEKLNNESSSRSSDQITSHLQVLSRIWGDLPHTIATNLLNGFDKFFGLHSQSKNCVASLGHYMAAADAYFNSILDIPPPTLISFGNEEVDLEDEFNDEKMTSRGRTEIVDYIKYHADVGDSNFQRTAGAIYLSGGPGIKRDYALAMDYLSKSSPDDHIAKSVMAYMYQRGLGIKTNISRAVELYQDAADSGNGYAMMQLGLLYLRGIHFERDLEKAYNLFNQAVKNHHEAFTYMLEVHLDKRSLHFDIDKAKTILLHAQELSIYSRLLYYSSRLETHLPCNRRVEKFKHLIATTYFKSIRQRAHQYYIDEKYERALLMYDILATLGDTLSQKNAAWIYSKSISYGLTPYSFFEKSEHIVDIDPKKHSIELYKLAAQQDSDTANLKLGDIYYYGHSVERNMNLSAAYYVVGATLRNARSAFNMGYMYQYGKGVPKNLFLAQTYYEMAMKYSREAYLPSTIALYYLWFYTRSSLLIDAASLASVGSLILFIYLMSKKYNLNGGVNSPQPQQQLRENVNREE